MNMETLLGVLTLSIVCAVVVGAVVLVAVLVVVLVSASRGKQRVPLAPQGLQPRPQAANVCLSCGTVNPPDTSFCSRCGEKLYEEIL